MSAKRKAESQETEAIKKAKKAAEEEEAEAEAEGEDGEEEDLDGEEVNNFENIYLRFFRENKQCLFLG